MRFFNFAIARLAVSVILGTILGQYLVINTGFLIIIFLFILILLCWLAERRKLLKSLCFEFLALIIFVVIGWVNVQLRKPEFQENHFSNYSPREEAHSLHLKITRTLRSDNFYHKYIAIVQGVDSIPCSGNLLVKISKQNFIQNISIDTQLLVYVEPTEIPQPLNPGQFNYLKFMARQGVFHLAEFSDHHIIAVSSGKPTIQGLADRMRRKLITKLRSTEINLKEQQLIQALVLGEKTELDRDMYKDYAAAGAVHMLAVSGLHVGIIYLIIAFLLRPLNYLRRGYIVSYLVLVVLLWIYAMITGLSPSVTRAVFMFSCFAFAKIINRHSNALNSCFLSLFFLLLINPDLLFQVGFQLSYLAVFSIVILQPKLASLYRPKWILDRLFWDITTVSLAAQIGVTPLTVFYFNQFPGLFLLSNLTLLPLLGIIIGAGIVQLIMLSFDFRLPLYEHYYGKVLEIMNGYVNWIASQETFMLEEVNFSGIQLICSYMIILWIISGIYSRSIIRLKNLLILGLLTVVVNISDPLISGKSQLIVFHKSGNSILAFRTHNNNLKVF